jgi:uridine kinase
MNIRRTDKTQTYIMNKIVKIANNDKFKLIKKSENNYKDCVEEAAKFIRRNIKNKNLLLICGPSSSGKTTTSHLITKHLLDNGIKSYVVSMDNFFINREETPILPDGTRDYDNVTTLNLDLFKSCVNDLLIKKQTDLPMFDFITGIRQDNAIHAEIDDNTIIIIEGIHAFNPLCISSEMKEKAVKVFVKPQSDFVLENKEKFTCEDLRFTRRSIRDFYTRSYSFSDTLKNWRNVRASEDKFIIPFKNDADFIIDTTYMYEPILYRNELEIIQEQDDEAKVLYQKLKMPKTPLTKNDISQDALIWEFLGA